MTSKLITLPKTSINGVTRAVLTDLETRFQQFQDHIKSANPDIDIDELRSIIVPTNDELSGLFKPGKAAKKIKDPAKPKRAATAYMLWLAENRETIKAELGASGEKVSVTDVTKEGGKRWKAMSDDDKTQYVEKAKELSAEYKTAMESYAPSSKVYSKTETDFISLAPEDAPEGYEGPFVGEVVYKYAIGCKKGTGIFNTLEEAVEAAKALDEGVQFAGITRDKKGYSLRKFAELRKDASTVDSVSWLLKGQAKAEKPKAEKPKAKAKKTEKPKKVEKAEKPKKAEKVEKPKAEKPKAEKAKKVEKPKAQKPKKSKKTAVVSVVVAPQPEEFENVIEVETETFGTSNIEKADTVVEESDAEDNAEEGEQDDEDVAEVTEISIDGVTYYHDESDDTLYDEEGTPLGKLVDGKCVEN